MILHSPIYCCRLMPKRMPFKRPTCAPRSIKNTEMLHGDTAWKKHTIPGKQNQVHTLHGDAACPLCRDEV